MRARRDSNRDRLNKGLGDAQKPKPKEFHSQGSYAMRTMVQHPAKDYDVDDGAYFKDGDLVDSNGGKLTGLQVRQMVCDALQDGKFTKSPEVRGNCVRVYYNEGYHFDIPSYREIETKNSWDGKLSYSYELASDDWKPSDAREVTEWFKAKNQELSPDPDSNGGQFRRIVRLLKKFARSREDWTEKIATGLMITKLAQEKYAAFEDHDDQALREAMRGIRDCLTLNKVIEHPVLKDEELAKTDDARPGFLHDKLDENLKHLDVLDKNDCSHSDAMKAWDAVFDTDWFSKQPDPGSKSQSGSGAPSKAVEKKGGGRYA